MRQQLTDPTTLAALRQAFGVVGIREGIRAFYDPAYALKYRIGDKYETIGAGTTLEEAITDAKWELAPNGFLGVDHELSQATQARGARKGRAIPSRAPRTCVAGH